MAEDLFGRIDLNRDGVVDREEFKAWHRSEIQDDKSADQNRRETSSTARVREKIGRESMAIADRDRGSHRGCTSPKAPRDLEEVDAGTRRRRRHSRASRLFEDTGPRGGRRQRGLYEDLYEENEHHNTTETIHRAVRGIYDEVAGSSPHRGEEASWGGTAWESEMRFSVNAAALRIQDAKRRHSEAMKNHMAAMDKHVEIIHWNDTRQRYSKRYS